MSTINFFEQELRELFGNSRLINSPTFSGRACLGDLGADLRVRIEFSTSKMADLYDTLKVTVLNRTGGTVDTLNLNFRDVLGVKPVPNNPNFEKGIVPHIWIYHEEAEWYAYKPTQADRDQLCMAVGQYLNNFRDRTRTRPYKGPKLIYVCAPLRGDVEGNVEFAQQKAQEIYENGDVPICPHLMFVPIADPRDRSHDHAVRELGMKVMESCYEVHVYGPEWTEGMWEEIQRAMELNIPVKTDQKTLGRTTSRKRLTQER